jgi:hypothetical protein
MEILELTFNIENGKSGNDDSADNPLARATDCLFRQGRPFYRLSKCFFRGPDQILRWLGIFVHSDGDRIIFFPGFAEPQMHVTGYNDQSLRWNRPFKIDHLSLESDRLSWHFTTPQSTDHLGKMYTRHLGCDVMHWFSMSVNTQDELRIVRENTIVSAATPSGDIGRRVDVFRRAREDALFQLVTLNTQHPNPEKPNFLHFSVTVGPSGFDSPGIEIFGLPHGSPLFKPMPHEMLANVPIRVHRIALSNAIDVEILATALPGELHTGIVFSGSQSSTA